VAVTALKAGKIKYEVEIHFIANLVLQLKIEIEIVNLL